jgi:hypothetical protein
MMSTIIKASSNTCNSIGWQKRIKLVKKLTKRDILVQKDIEKEIVENVQWGNQ